MTIKSVDIAHVVSRIKAGTGVVQQSAARDVSAYDRVMVLFKTGNSAVASAMGTVAIRVAHHDTVSATYSGMTALSGITGITTSGNIRMFDFQRTKKFAGFLISSTSGTHAGIMLGYNSEIQPVAAAQGFTAVNRIS